MRGEGGEGAHQDTSSLLLNFRNSEPNRPLFSIKSIALGYFARALEKGLKDFMRPTLQQVGVQRGPSTSNLTDFQPVCSRVV